MQLPFTAQILFSKFSEKVLILKLVLICPTWHRSHTAGYIPNPSKTKSLKLQMQPHLLKLQDTELKKKPYFSQKLMKIYPANAQIVKFIIQTEGYVCILIHKIKTSGFVSLNIHFKSTLLNNSKTSSGNNFT